LGLYSVTEWYFLTDVSGQTIGPIIKGQDPLEKGQTDYLETSVENNRSKLPKIQ